MPLVGRFCHACGEDSAPPRRELKALLADLADNIFSFTEHVPTTLKDLAVDPGRILRGLRDGDTRRYLSPFKLYVSATVVFFLFLSLSGVTIFQLEVTRTGGPVSAVVRDGELKALRGVRISEVWLHPTQDDLRDQEVVRVLEDATARMTDPVNRAAMEFVRRAADDPQEVSSEIGDWAPRLLWLLMPVFALLLWPLYRRGALMVDHFIFALWAHTSFFLLLILGSLWNFTGLGWGFLVALLVYQAYLTVGLKGYYGRSWTGAVLKGGLHSLVYFGLIWLPITVAYFLWQVFKRLPPEMLLSE